MQTFWTIVFFIFGASLGSFASVLISRFHADEGEIFWGRSKCCHTGKTLPWYDLIPVFSWLFLGGKSRFSGKKIPAFYFWIEVLFGAVFALFAWKFSQEFLLENVWKNIWLFLILFLTLVLFFYDALFMEVDRRISWPAILLAGGMIFFQEDPRNFLIGGTIGFGFYFLQYFLSKGRWVGAGDQELGLFMGLLLGWKNFLLALFLSYIIGFLWALILLLFQKGVTRKTAVPMGAFLMPALVAFLYDSEIWWNWYEQLFSFEWMF